MKHEFYHTLSWFGDGAIVRFTRISDDAEVRIEMKLDENSSLEDIRKKVESMTDEDVRKLFV